VGIDEAGRGALAGPLVVAAVVGESNKLRFCKDSKRLSAKKRDDYFDEIYNEADSIGIGWASAGFIDKHGLSKALTRAAQIAFSQISQKNHPIIIDGPYDFLKLKIKNIQAVIKADSKYKQVSAASIVAKVSRDRYMYSQSKKFPGWEFDKHVGYGTKKHLEELINSEPTKLHRKSFKPLNGYIESRKTSRSNRS